MINSLNETRERKLQKSFDDFWNKAFKTNNIKYYERMDLLDIVGLKKIVAQINNIITLQTTLRFVDYLPQDYNSIKEEIKQQIQKVDVNTNGYDIKFNGARSNKISFIAEVKCNIPKELKNTYSFMSQQVQEIKDDLTGLRNSNKDKSAINYCKFMIVLDDDGVKEAMEKIINAFNQSQKKSVVMTLGDKRQLKIQNFNELDNSIVYVVYV